MSASMNDEADSYYFVKAHANDGVAKTMSLDLPFNQIDTWTYITAAATPERASDTGMMTDLHMALIDDTAPSVKDIQVSRDVRTDGTADLVLTMTFNEGIRFASMAAEDQLDHIWVEVELQNLETGKRTTARLYIESINQNAQIVFRGDIGLYNYNNFRVNRITKLSLPSSNWNFERSLVDLADEMYVSPYETKQYNNGIFNAKSGIYDYDYDFTATTIITDHAGNSISTAGITNWSFGDQSYISNTFEAVDVQIYNDVAYGKLLTPEDEKYERTDMFVGPANTMSAYVYLDEHLTDEEAKKVAVAFNILNKDGTFLTVKATSSNDYVIDEMYANGKQTGTVLAFEGIPLYEGMRLDVPEGGEPLVKIVSMTDEIEDKTAYPYVKEPSTVLYADLTAPETEVRLVAEGTVEPTEAGQSKNYHVTMEITAKDVASHTEIAGMRNTQMRISLGGGVTEDTGVRYILSETQVPPAETVAASYPCELTLAPNGMTAAMFTLNDGSLSSGYPVLSDEAKFYLHLFIEGGELLLDDFYVQVYAEDIAGNIAEVEPPAHIDYLVDGIAPVSKFTGVKRETVIVNDKARINVTVNIEANDYSRIDRMLYYIGEDYQAEGAEWQVLVIEPGTTVTGRIQKQYGDDADESDKVYHDILWVKAIDEHGNESKPVAKYITLSTQKPITDSTYETDLNRVSNAHKILVTGAPLSDLDQRTAYTRVYVTPVDDPEYSYVTLVKTGETADILGFKNLTWYKVKVSLDDVFTEVSGPEAVGTDYTLTQSSILYDLFTYYGELKISFENGYGDMVPVQGEYIYEATDAGSFAADPNYYVARYTSPFYTGTAVHAVDFGAMIDRDDITVVADADKGAAAYLFNATRKGINPMRNTQIHFSISNIAKSSFGLLDFDYESSFAELIHVDGEGIETVVSVQSGLSAAGSQYFTIRNTDDAGAYYKSGAYYLRVTVVSRGGREDSFESSRLVLDAETADDAGLWQYSRQTVTDITKTDGSRVSWKTEYAQGEPFTDIGVVATVGGEQMRSSVFAVYSYGSTGLSLILKTPDPVKTVEGIEIGGVEGFKLWNLASDPTAEEVEARYFERSNSIAGDVYFHRTNGLDEIYDEDTIPKGAEGFDELHLMKGINTICYQYKMENGYVSPIRQFTVTVTDYTPELNIAIDDYRISHDASEIDGMINAHSVRFFVETAYSLNGSGNVSVDLWSDYGMNVGEKNTEGELVDAFYSDPTPGYSGQLAVLRSGLEVEEYADFTENSYTSDFPKYSQLCTAVFVATDEFGGVTIVAPQLGDHIRYGTVTGSELDDVYNIDYDDYYDDPYVLDDSFLSWQITYNQPQYFGAQVLSFDNTLWRNSASGEKTAVETLMVSNAEIKYNLFNIVTNDITFSLPRQYGSADTSGVGVEYNNCTNLDLMLLDAATITFSGGDLAEPVTLPFGGEDNTIGYMGGSVSGSTLVFSLANPRADGTTHKVGDTVTRQFTIHCTNRFGDVYTTGGQVTLYYIDYSATVSMTDAGAVLHLTFETKEYGTEVRTGQFSNGSGTYTVTDYYSSEATTYTFTVTDAADPDTAITVSKFTKTSEPVVIQLERTDGTVLDVPILDYDLMRVEGSGSSAVTVTVYGNITFAYRYAKNGTTVEQTVRVDNIVKPDPKTVWNYDEEDYTEAQDGTKYRYGEVTVYLVDSSFVLLDRYTGSIPSYTFTPGGNTVYTFKAEDIMAVLNGEEITLTEDVTVQLPITLYEIPDIAGKNVKDNETPNVQVLAYRMDGSYSSDARLSLQLENARNSTALNDYHGYTIYDYVGNRATMSQLLRDMGWTPAARFEIQTLDMSRVRLFVREGLYATAPDYETGVSDSIPGVTLQSKLLTVTAQAKFTLFVVDSHNNASAIVFDVTNIGSAPSPTVVKVTDTDALGNAFVRAYILPPDGAADFEILGTTDVKVEGEGEYAGRLYVDYTDNDDYVINYSFLYNEVEVKGTLDLNVSEINLREIEQVGSIEWSANKADEATPHNIVATVKFTEMVAALVALTEYDESAVHFTVMGDLVTVVYTDNHASIRLACSDVNGNVAYVELDQVTNINRDATVIEITERVLAPDGKSVVITFASSERAMLDGFFGEEGADGRYYFTRRIAANGDYTYTFADVTGLTTVFGFTVDELVLDALTVSYSLSPDGANAVDNAEELDVEIGDSFYINPGRDVTAELSGKEPIALRSGTWTEIVVPDGLGETRPYIILTDAYGNVLTQQFSRVQVPDTAAPEILIGYSTYSVRLYTDLEAVQNELLANFTAMDDTTSRNDIIYEVRFTADMQTMGIFAVEYRATDEAGNTAVKMGKLRVTSPNEPTVSYNGNKLFRDGNLVLAEGTDVVLDIDSSALYYKVILADGINTVAQMKLYGTTVQGYGTGDKISLGALEAGTYTIAILNQERDYFLLYIAIVEPEA